MSLHRLQKIRQRAAYLEHLERRARYFERLERTSLASARYLSLDERVNIARETATVVGGNWAARKRGVL